MNLFSDPTPSRKYFANVTLKEIVAICLTSICHLSLSTTRFGRQFPFKKLHTQPETFVVQNQNCWRDKSRWEILSDDKAKTIFATGMHRLSWPEKQGKGIHFPVRNLKHGNKYSLSPKDLLQYPCLGFNKIENFLRDFWTDEWIEFPRRDFGVKKLELLFLWGLPETKRELVGLVGRGNRYSINRCSTLGGPILDGKSMSIGSWDECQLTGIICHNLLVVPRRKKAPLFSEINTLFDALASSGPNLFILFLQYDKGNVGGKNIFVQFSRFRPSIALQRKA